MNRSINPASIVPVLLMALLLALGVCGRAQEDGDDVSIGKYRILHSDVLGEDRTLLIHLPRDYEATDFSYPVVFHLYADVLSLYYCEAVADLSQLGEHAQMPQAILVGIANVDRYRDQLPLRTGGTTEGVDNFLRFFEDELIPFLKANYRTKDYYILVGPQAGGAFGFYAAFTRPGLFDALILESPFLNPDTRNCDFLIELAENYLAGNDSLKAFMQLSHRGDGAPARELEYIYKFKAQIENRRPADLTVDIVQVHDTEAFIPSVELRRGLRALFGGFEFGRDRQAENLEEITGHFRQLSERLGFEVDIPEMVLYFQANGMLQRGDYSEALEVLDFLIRLYPNSLGGYWYRANAHRGAGRIEQAIADYRKCLALDPNMHPARRALEELASREQ